MESQAFQNPFGKAVVGGIHTRAAGGRGLRSGVGAHARPGALSELSFLPANLSRVVVDAYREPCFTKVSLGGRFAAEPLELAIPLVVAPLGYGAVSAPVRRAVARAAARLGTAYGTGEGGLVPDEAALGGRYIYQVGPGRLGVRPADLMGASAVELVLDTANHGAARYLDPAKLSPEVAAAWGVEPGLAIHTPASHLDFHDLETLRLKIAELREATGHRIPICLKAGGDMEAVVRLALQCDIDLLALDGLESSFAGGSRGAVSSVGQPVLAALCQAVETLRSLGREEDVDLIVMGGLRDGADAAKCLALGAKAVALGTGPLVAMGCQACGGCAGGQCPAGIATADPDKLAAFDEETALEGLCNYFQALTAEIQMIARLCGKYYVASLEPEDMRALSVDTARLTGVALAGTERIYPREKGAGHE